MTTEPTDAKENDAARKPYETPRLETYGDIRVLTESVGMSGMLDGGNHNMTRTR